MNRKEAAEIAAYAAALKHYNVNAIRCFLRPGDRFTFPNSDVELVAGKAGWHTRPDGTKGRTGRLTAVMQTRIHDPKENAQ